MVMTRGLAEPLGLHTIPAGAAEEVNRYRRGARIAIKCILRLWLYSISARKYYNCNDLMLSY